MNFNSWYESIKEESKSTPHIWWLRDQANLLHTYYSPHPSISTTTVISSGSPRALRELNCSSNNIIYWNKHWNRVEKRYQFILITTIHFVLLTVNAFIDASRLESPFSWRAIKRLATGRPSRSRPRKKKALEATTTSSTKEPACIKTFRRKMGNKLS